jgi:hypothetical protein
MRAFGRALWWTLVVTHRYLGVAVCLLMAMWFGSGIVMMYVGFPQLTEAKRTAALSAVPWQECCRVSLRIGDDEQILRAQIESLLGVPIVRLRRPGRPDLIVDLAEGAATRVDPERARAIALDTAPRIIGARADIRAIDVIDEDQWTVGRHLRDRPLYRFGFDDPKGTTLYVSAANGQIVLWTTAPQRFWNWFGSVPHWLYLTALRSDGPLWTQVMIWTALLGTFLTVVGLVIGIVQFRRRDISPYRGLFYWHHLAGLVFGIVTLTWVFSGLVSMNPWGFLESRGRGEQTLLQGRPLTWAQVRTSLAALPADLTPDIVSLTSAPYADNLYWLATHTDGRVRRLDSSGQPAPLSDGDLEDAARRLAADRGIAQQGMRTTEDTYYFHRNDPLVLPVYRITLDDAERTRFYLDPTSGAFIQRTDAKRRWHRWLFSGLHRLDFTATLRTRPLWDIVMIVLSLGGIGLSLTGCWLAIRRIRQDVAGLARRALGSEETLRKA